MKDTYIAWLIVFGIAWGIFVFASYTAGLKRSLIKPQAQSSEPERLRTSQKQIAEDTEEKRKQLMESLQQKVKDSRKDF